MLPTLGAGGTKRSACTLQFFDSSRLQEKRGGSVRPESRAAAFDLEGYSKYGHHNIFERVRNIDNEY